MQVNVITVKVAAPKQLFLTVKCTELDGKTVNVATEYTECLFLQFAGDWHDSGVPSSPSAHPSILMGGTSAPPGAGLPPPYTFSLTPQSIQIQTVD